MNLQEWKPIEGLIDTKPWRLFAFLMRVWQIRDRSIDLSCALWRKCLHCGTISTQPIGMLSGGVKMRCRFE
jgi:hypothetical protein